MLIATQSTSIAGTQQYFDQVLTKGDYYLGQEVAGHWHGKGADILGVGEGAKVTKEAFNSLLEGNHPKTGQQLTQRLRPDRRPGVDLTFSVPKSVSLAWAILEDEQILDCLREAVHETMQRDVEPLMHRRVREGEHANSQHRQQTGKLIYADFLHKTSRPVDGTADPHLHIHAFVVNWTEENGKHYAAEMEEIIRQRPSLQAKFEARLAHAIEKLGYDVDQTRYVQSGKVKRGWEIRGIDRPTIEKFSRRTQQIEQFAAEHDIQDAERKGQLGKITRDRKNEGLTIAQLRPEWRSRLSDDERHAFAHLRRTAAPQRAEPEAERAAKAVEYALAHHLFRQSTVERHQVVATALEQAVTLRPEQIEKALANQKLITRTLEVSGAKRELVTTRSVLQAERDMIAFARDGRGTVKAINAAEHKFAREWLNDHQQAAVRQVLESRDRVVAIVGGAGTGKTSLMKEAVEAIEMKNRKVFTFAPSTGGKEVLQDKGFRQAETVEHLIRNTKLQEEVRGQVLWIDEAGLVDVRSMNAVFNIAREQKARVVLSGDSRQHASPRRGEAMRLLEQEAGLKLARVEKIQRQKDDYRRAMELISKGHDVVDQRTGATGLLAGFDLLDRLGKIQEIATEERYEKLATRYVEAAEAGKSTLVVAPTHAEGAAVTEEIRSQLKTAGKLEGKEQTVLQYRSLNLTEAEKGDARAYRGEGKLIVQFHQNTAGGFKRGERYEVTGQRDGQVQLRGLSGGERRVLPLTATDRFEVYAHSELALAVGDKVRFTLGGKTHCGGKRVANGRLDEVAGFDRQGNIKLKNGWKVSRDYAHLDLGYVITSHASQGKDRHIAIGAMGSESLPAINARQFYVTVSRGSEDVALYVDNKARIRRAIQRSGEQLSATELVRSGSEAKSDYAYERHHTEDRQRVASSFERRLRDWCRAAGERVAGAMGMEPRGMGMGITGPSLPGLGMQPSPGRSN